MKKIIILFLLLSSFLFGAKPIYTIIMSESVPNGYAKDAYKKSIVLMTEARLYLQKKYKKKITFKYQESLLKSKDTIFKMLKEEDARFYVSLSINKKKSKDNLEKVLYNLNIYDIHTKRKKTVKTKALIRDKKIVQISQGNLKSSAKKIAKVLKNK